MAISGVDNALWDLKARLLGLPLVTLLGAVRDGVLVYGSGGFTTYSDERLRDQLGGWAASGITRVKMKIGTQPGRDLARVEVARARDRPLDAAFRGRERRLHPQAGAGVRRAVRGTGGQVVRGAGAVRRHQGAPAAPRPCTGRHGHRSRGVRVHTWLLPANARGGRGGRAAGGQRRAAAASRASSGQRHCARPACCPCRLIVRRRCTLTPAARYTPSATSSISTTMRVSSTCSSTAPRRRSRAGCTPTGRGPAWELS